MELRIPPVLVFAISIALMWLTGLITNEAGLNEKFRLVLGIILFGTGGCIALAGETEIEVFN